MRDIPVFTTQWGVASLSLSQIPYTQSAYIIIQDASDAQVFIKECADFCCAVGAERIYASGHLICEQFPFYTSIYKMRAEKNAVGETDVCLFPVTEKTISRWQHIYNEKIRHVPNGKWMDASAACNLLEQRNGYFIHRAGELLGTGIASGNTIFWACAVQKGAGKDVVRALVQTLGSDTVELEVASSNIKALNLYESIGFIPCQNLSSWYRIK